MTEEQYTRTVLVGIVMAMVGLVLMVAYAGGSL